MKIQNDHGKRFLYNVQFVLELGYNLLFVGQLMAGGYLVLFANDACIIKEKMTDKILVEVPMTENKMFLLDVSSMKKFTFTAVGKDDSSI